MLGLKDKHYGVASCAVRSLGRLALGVVIARRLGTDGYSLFVVLVATEVIATTLANALYAQPLLTMAPGLPERQRLALESYALRKVGHLSAAVLVLGVASALIVALMAERSAWTLVMFSGATAATVIADSCRAVRQGRFESRITVIGDAVAYGVPVTGLVLSSSGPATQTVMWGLLLAGQLLAIRIVRPRRVFERLEEESLRKFRDLAIPFASGSAAVSLSSRTQPYVLGGLASAAQLSWFGCAVSLMGPMRLLSGSLSAVLRPRLAKQHGHGDDVTKNGTLRKALFLQLLLGVVLLLLTIFAGTALARFVFGCEFAAVGGLLPVAVLFATMEGIGAIQTVAAQTRSADGARLATRSRCWAGAIGILLLLILCPLAGALGALWALVVAETVFLWLLLAPSIHAVKRARSIP